MPMFEICLQIQRQGAPNFGVKIQTHVSEKEDKDGVLLNENFYVYYTYSNGYIY